MSELTEFFTEKNVSLIAKEVVEHLNKNATKNNVEHDFQISKGEMVSKSVNTFFQYDPDHLHE